MTTYRKLQLDEIAAEGDQYYRAETGEWADVQLTGRPCRWNSPFLFYRRPILEKDDKHDETA